MVPPTSLRIPRVRRYSGYCYPHSHFAYETITLFGCASHRIQLYLWVVLAVHYPECISTLGLASSAFARHYLRNLGWFLFLRVLRCFSSPGSPHPTILFTGCSMILHHGGFPIRISTDLCLFAAPRSFSQLVTSFFGSWCQGIPLVLFLAWTSFVSLRYLAVLYFLLLELLCNHILQLLSFFIFRFWQNCLLTLNFGKTWFLYIKIISFYSLIKCLL